MTLLSAPIEIKGEWGASSADAIMAVVSYMREACLKSTRLLSDRQPSKLRIESHPDGLPAVWLECEQTAWIIVHIAERHWCQLAYQFGHELGHVLCNSWTPQAKAEPPCRWLEEALVEAFSVRGLAHLANAWETNSPFPGDSAYAAAIRKYRRDLIEKYGATDPDLQAQAAPDLRAWFHEHRNSLGRSSGLSVEQGPVILAVLREIEDYSGEAAEDMGALNRWPERSSVPVEQYLRLWEASCREVGARGRLVASLKALLLGPD